MPDRFADAETYDGDGHHLELSVGMERLPPPSLILQSPELRTIPLATFAFFGQYSKQWDMAALVLGITPIIIFFLSLQKYIVEGVAAGSVKGKGARLSQIGYSIFIYKQF